MLIFGLKALVKLVAVGSGMVGGAVDDVEEGDDPSMTSRLSTKAYERLLGMLRSGELKPGSVEDNTGAGTACPSHPPSTFRLIRGRRPID